MMKPTLLICFALVVCQLAQGNATTCDTNDDCSNDQCCIVQILKFGWPKECQPKPDEGNACLVNGSCSCKDGLECKGWFVGLCRASETTEPTPPPS